MENLREAVFKLLYEAGDKYISGEEISEKLGVTRAAVWKHIKAIEEEGYSVEAVRRLGYRLRANGIREVEVAPYLRTEWLGRDYTYLQEVNSTNRYAKGLADDGAVNGAVVAADYQTGGRGRLGRVWDSPSGSGVWFSLVLRPPISPEKAPQISLATAVGVAAGLKKLGYAAGIKWPNDIYIDGLKVCGMLTEMHGSMEAVDWVVVGIGINCLERELPPEIRDMATTLAMAGGKDVCRAEVLGEVLNSLEHYYNVLYTDGFAEIRRIWLEDNITLGKRVKISTINEVFYGEALDMREDGSLLVKREDSDEDFELVTGDVFFA